jgi:hypothetical protein
MMQLLGSKPPRASPRLFREAGALPGWAGGLWRRPFLGARDRCARPSGVADATRLRQAVREAQKDRCR